MSGYGPGGGYGHGYNNPPGHYPQQGYQQQPPQQQQQPQFNAGVDPNWNSPNHMMTVQQQQEMLQRQQIQQARSQTQAAFYQQPQYAPMPNVAASNGYYPHPPPQNLSPYLSYAQPYEQQYVQPQQYQQQQQQVHPQHQMAYHISQRVIPPPQISPVPQSTPLLAVPKATPVPLPAVPRNTPTNASDIRQAPPLQDNPPSFRHTPPIKAEKIPQKVQKPKVETPKKVQAPDILLLLASLAEEYFESAHKIAPNLARSMEEPAATEYQKAIATGLGCLEAALLQQKVRLTPRMEARLRLRFASVLFEETDNFQEAETCLTQGITLCEQNRYLDLKYSMQFMLVQLVYQKSPKAGLKTLEGICAEVAAYRHFNWEYVFHLLKASLTMRLHKTSDSQATLHDLHHISELAKDRGDHGVHLLSSLMEITVHLSHPGPEAKEQIQTALAAAWTYQTQPDSNVPQLLVVTRILDLMSSLVYELPSKAISKQESLTQTFKTSTWNNADDLVRIPIHKTIAQGTLVSRDTCAYVAANDDGKESLILSWLNGNDSYALFNLISGISLFHENAADSKALKYLRQGQDCIVGGKVSSGVTSSLPNAVADFRLRSIFAAYFHIYVTFCLASVTSWKGAREELKLLRSNLNNLGVPKDENLEIIYTYLMGICLQGSCDLDGALKMYSDPSLDISQINGPPTTPSEQLRQDLSILASLNSLWILQDGILFDPERNSDVLRELEPLCAHRSNINIQAAFNLVRATVTTKPETSSIHTKNYLGNALAAAKLTNNKQFVAIILSTMSAKFFLGVVGNQAEKAGKAAFASAKGARDSLWASVSSGMLADTLETQGKSAEAQSARTEAYRLAALTSPTLRAIHRG